MNIFYFIQDESDDRFHNIKMESWIEVEVVYNSTGSGKSYKRLEEINFHAATDLKSFECASLKISFGKDDCMGHHAKNRKDFLKAKLDESFRNYTQVDRERYEALRSKFFRIHDEQRCINFDTIPKKQEYNIRVLS
ncbi:hypothetical protein SAMN05216480_10518 [Pustulibacterium marinum]|uniref:Uncharacterized protein n=1 Tax=Pustulibacterium marinum TaxID=1224947 RepID=A0A1I7GK44_9FLAO|nr:hypothetical protein [Pustulibacterium marinum]SFU48798.1 hypothetical protein SAMN05216480_10518 [Pustulibacterium marinum]